MFLHARPRHPSFLFCFFCFLFFSHFYHPSRLQSFSLSSRPSFTLVSNLSGLGSFLELTRHKRTSHPCCWFDLWRAQRTRALRASLVLYPQLPTHLLRDPGS
ncbi:hypothetical protein V8F33_001054 [Rhypophila sp. PSN 637]